MEQPFDQLYLNWYANTYESPYLNWYVHKYNFPWAKGKLGSLESSCWLITDAIIDTFNIVNGIPKR